MKMNLIERLVYPLARGMIRQAFEEGFKGADEAGELRRKNAIAHRESTISELQDSVKQFEFAQDVWQSRRDWLQDRVKELEVEKEANWIALQTVSKLVKREEFKIKELENPWVSVDKEMPEAGLMVLVRMQYAKGSKTVCFTAKYTAKFTEEADDFYGDYDEKTDTYYCPEGWYENQTNWDGEYGYIFVNEGKVIEWLTIPPITGAG